MESKSKQEVTLGHIFPVLRYYIGLLGSHRL